jgi:hypothetical protein
MSISRITSSPFAQTTARKTRLAVVPACVSLPEGGRRDTASTRAPRLRAERDLHLNLHIEFDTIVNRCRWRDRL